MMMASNYSSTSTEFPYILPQSFLIPNYILWLKYVIPSSDSRFSGTSHGTTRKGISCRKDTKHLSHKQIFPRLFANQSLTPYLMLDKNSSMDWQDARQQILPCLRDYLISLVCMDGKKAKNAPASSFVLSFFGMVKKKHYLCPL